MIRIKCGTCGTSQGYKTNADGELSLPTAEETRLVARGVAEYVTRPIIGGATPCGTSEHKEAGVNTPDESTASESSDEGEGADETETHDGAVDVDCVLDIVDGHFTKESLTKMERKDMEALAIDLGLDVKKCRNKGEIADLLSAVEVQPEADAGEAPPDLSIEGPVE